MKNGNVASSDGIYDARTLGRPKMLILGLQHLFAMFGATILVPILVNGYYHGQGLSVQVTLFCAGFGTLLFHACTKFKVPAFLGSSFAFLGGFATVAELPEFANMSYAEKLPYACGGVVVAGMLYLVLALLIKLIGPQKVMRFLPPVVTGPIIFCIGIGLEPSAIANAEKNWPLAIISMAVIIFIGAILGEGKDKGKYGMIKNVPILIGVVVAYVAALIMQSFGFTNSDASPILDTASIADAGWVGVPPFAFAKFHLSAILAMAPNAIAAMMEHVGDMSAISETTNRNLIEEPGLSRTLLGDGLATAFAGAVMGPANTTYGENTGVLELSRVFDPVVIRIAAIYAIIISFVPKISAIFGSMPTAVVGGISILLYGMISGIGVRNLVENQVDLKKMRNLFIIALILAAGLGSNGLTFSIGNTPITLTSVALASIIGIIANAVLPGKDYVFGKDKKKDSYRGLHM